jgi:hypothetical protein
MRRQDTRTERLIEARALREQVSCVVLLERLGTGWALDNAESTRNCLKFRRGSAVLIVNHQGRGWWDPHRAWDDKRGRGDVFTLVQHLRPGLNFGQVRQVLRGLVGVRPSYTLHEREHRYEPVLLVAERWARRPRLSRGSAVWRYLADTRGLPGDVLLTASRADAVREGAHGSAWFAHRDQAGRLTGIEMRGPDWRGFAKHATKALFRLPGSGDALTRLAVCEAPIDALSLAALEGLRPDTLYASTSGGMGPQTLACLRALLQGLAAHAHGVLVAAIDADRQGGRYADQLAAMAAEAGVRSERLLPPNGHNDWNDALVAARQARRTGAVPGAAQAGAGRQRAATQLTGAAG